MAHDANPAALPCHKRWHVLPGAATRPIQRMKPIVGAPNAPAPLSWIRRRTCYTTAPTDL